MSETVITSSQNQYVSLVRSLMDRKSRERQRLYRIDGVKLLCEAVSRGAKIRLLMLCEGQSDAVCAKAQELYGIKLRDSEFVTVTVASHIFEKLSDENAPEGIIAVMDYDGERHRQLDGADVDAQTSEKILLLESVRDPQNVGAIIRAAAAFGADRMIISRDCADIYNPKTLRASMGALFSQRIDRVGDINAAIAALKSGGRRVFAAALDDRAQRLGSLEIRNGDCVIIGNEGHGLSETTVSACTDSVYIPMSDAVESLNAATAAAVLAWEFFGK